MGQTLLTARALRYRPPGQSADVLDGLSFDLARGEVVDVSGPSGAGKTTLLRALARLLPDALGTLSLAGTSADDVDPHVWRTRVALLPQVAAVRPGTVRDNLVLPWTLKVRAAEELPTNTVLDQALADVGLGDIALDRDVARLSVGQTARVSLLRVMLTRPEVLLLDEPDANLDDDSASQVGELAARFARDGGGVVRVRHLQRGTAVTRRVRLAAGQLEEVSLS